MANGHVKSPNSALMTTSAPRTSGGPVIPSSDASGASTDRTVPTELLPADRVEHPAELPLVGQPDERGWDRPDPLGDLGKGGDHLLEVVDVDVVVQPVVVAVARGTLAELVRELPAGHREVAPFA